jgi:hypothetical protein
MVEHELEWDECVTISHMYIFDHYHCFLIVDPCSQYVESMLLQGQADLAWPLLSLLGGDADIE